MDYLGAALLFAITSSLVFIFDRRTHQTLDSMARGLLVAVFIICLAWFLFHESRTKHPFVDLSLFKIRRFSCSVVSLLIIAMGYSLTGFLMPFYLQDILHLTATKVGILFMIPSVLTVALAPLSGTMSDRYGPRVPATIGVVLMILTLTLGGFLSVDSNWLLPAGLIVLSASTNGMFNPANSTAMIAMMPREHRGFASAINTVTFGFGNVFGVALGGLSMSLAFEYYTGIKVTSLTTANPDVFVAALRTTYVATIALTMIALFTSALRGGEKPGTEAVQSSRFKVQSTP